MSKNRIIPTDFKKLLDTETGERKVHSYLRENPKIPYYTFCPASGHDQYVFSGFPLGSEFESDLVILDSYSGAWKALFIELEPVGDQVFTRKGTPSKRLAIAIRQIDDWRDYVNKSLEVVRRDLVRWAKKHDLLGLSPGGEPCNFSNDYLAHPETIINFEYLIIIGRSSKFDKRRRQLAGRFSGNHGIEIVTYDRMLEFVNKR